MSKITDQKYLKDEQYKTPHNLQARIELHRRFGTNPYGWQRWVFDQLDFRSGMHVFEVGCGPGDLWRENTGQLPMGMRVTLGDYSVGMVQKARQAVAGGRDFVFLNLDVQAIPFPMGSFDLVIANHMLYHAPSIQRGVRELARVLRPGGRLCAATNGIDHMRELGELIEKFRPGYQRQKVKTRRFALENGARILEAAFDEIEVRCYEENLVVTEVEPLLAYIFSMWDLFEDTTQELAGALEESVRDQMHSDGQFFITKSQGVFIGRVMS